MKIFDLTNRSLICIIHDFPKKVRRKLNRLLYKNHVDHIVWHNINTVVMPMDLLKILRDNKSIPLAGMSFKHCIIFDDTFIDEIKDIIDKSAEGYTTLYYIEVFNKNDKNVSRLCKTKIKLL